MTLSEAAMAAAVTVSVAGVSYAVLNTSAVTDRAKTVAAAATCRAVDEAIVGFVAQYDKQPATIAQLRPFVDGDIAAYRIVAGRAAGPGC